METKAPQTPISANPFYPKEEPKDKPEKRPVPISFGHMDALTDTGKKLIYAVEYLAHHKIITSTRATKIVAKIRAKHKKPIGQPPKKKLLTL